MMFVTTSAYVVLDVIVTLYQVQEAAVASSEADERTLTKLYVAENAILRWNVRQLDRQACVSRPSFLTSSVPWPHVLNLFAP